MRQNFSLHNLKLYAIIYKENLNRNKTQYKILSEEVQSDGSIVIEIKKQYNTSPTGNYLN